MLVDVCKALGLEQVSRVKDRLKDGVTNSKGIIQADILNNLGRTQKATWINESNLYKVIFQSRKNKALKFQEWVTSEVLPSIRKHGMYAKEELLDNPDLLIEVATKLKQEREKRLQLENTLKKEQPRIEFAKQP